MKGILPDQIDIPSDNKCNSPEISIYNKHSKLNKSKSLLDDSKDEQGSSTAVDESSAQKLMVTINEQGATSSANEGSSSKITEKEDGSKEKQKMIITGDDILIEYV